MADGLPESTVRQHLRDQPGEVIGARCLARLLNLDLSAAEAFALSCALVVIVAPIMAASRIVERRRAKRRRAGLP